MNDPGLQDPIKDAAPTVDGFDGSEAEDEKAFIEPSRWWFAKTACPLIAGTFGPMANAFSICALGQHWREYLPPGSSESNGVDIQDPRWLLAVNGVSLAFALIANLTLLLNMANRLKFSIAQPMTVIGFYLASFLLIGCVGPASANSFHVYPAAEEALTQAFYYGIWAAALYFIIAVLMTITVFGAVMGKYPKNFDLTTSQRTLMLQTISFMVYLLIGALIFSHIEDWRYLDALYWADITLLTVGFGDDLVPLTHAGRSLVIPFTIGGILSVGLIIGSIRSMLLEQGKIKMRARVTEKKRQKVRSIPQVLKHQMPGKKFDMPKDITERDRRRLEFHAMKQIQTQAKREREWTALALSTTAAAVLWFIGALVYYHTEYKQGWTYFVSMYFTWVSLITLGYGDYQVQSNSGRAFFVLWSLLAIPTLTVLISDMGDTIVKGVADATNWLGSLTILPGKQKKRSSGWKGLIGISNKQTQEPPFPIQERRDAKEKIEDTKGQEADEGAGHIAILQHETDPHRTGQVRDIMKARMSGEDKETWKAFETKCEVKKVQPHTRFYHWLLIKEINRVLQDTSETPPKKYTYDEWAYFLRLLGHNENEPSLHHCPNPRPTSEKPEDVPQLGTIFNRDGSIRAWSWLGFRSPLMSQKEEADWILQQLTWKLQRDMQTQSDSNEAIPVDPPIHLDDLHWNEQLENGAPKER